MSIKAMNWAWGLRDLSGTEKLVLIALADHSDDDGLCWPGLKGVASKCCILQRTVQKTVHRLAEIGLVAIEPRQDQYGRPTSNYYRLCLKEGGNLFNGRDSIPSNGRVKAAHDHPNLQENYQEENLYRPSDSPPSGEVAEAVKVLKPEELLEGWNDICADSGLSRVLELSGTRRQKCLKRLAEHPTETWWETALNNIANSTFCRGLEAARNNGEKPWRATFDWLIENDTNAVKAYEGRYNK